MSSDESIWRMRVMSATMPEYVGELVRCKDCAYHDERREVARKIREYVDAYGDKIEDAEMVLLGTVWCRGEVGEVVRPTSEAELLAMVADLIDPTCHVIDMGWPNDYAVVRECDACGGSWTQDPLSEPYRFCPRCGARVVSHD